MTSTPTNGRSPSAGARDTAVQTSRPMPSPASSVFLNLAKSTWLGKASQYLQSCCQSSASHRSKEWRFYPMKIPSCNTQSRTPSIEPHNGPRRSFSSAAKLCNDSKEGTSLLISKGNLFTSSLMAEVASPRNRARLGCLLSLL